MVFCVHPLSPHHQVTLGGSAAQAGLQRGDVILEVNGYSMRGENDLERLKQLAEAEPPLCLKLATRSPPQGLEAWIPPGSGKVRKRQRDYEQPQRKTEGNQRGGQSRRAAG